MKEKILIIEDEQNIQNFMSAALLANSYDVITAKSGAEAYTMIFSHCPDIIILDLGLPDLDGMEIIRKMREWADTPIIVVSARTLERDKVEALDAGADDYLTKPFGMPELLARIRTTLRHFRKPLDSGIPTNGNYTVGDLTIDYDKHCAFIHDKDTRLTNNEFKIVALLSRYAGKVLTYDFIQKELWGPMKGSDNQVLRVHMANIRRKIEKNPAEPEYIFTEVGVGYRMAESGEA